MINQLGKVAMEVAESVQLDTERLIESGVRGCHVLFDNETIHRAYAEDAEFLCMAVEDRIDDIQETISLLLSMDTSDARQFLSALSPEIRSILVLLYFELLDNRLYQKAVFH